jgi:outer membrane lipoprotein-sorting protein
MKTPLRLHHPARLPEAHRRRGPARVVAGLAVGERARAWWAVRRAQAIVLVFGLVLGLSLGLAPTAAPAQAAAFDLKALTALLATRSTAEARFSEERFVIGLDQPLRASGSLSFTAPDRFARHTLAPRAESMVVEGNTVTWTRGGRTRQTALDTTPELTALVEAVRGTLGGDAETLQRHFSTQVAGNPQSWRLTLVPLDRRLGGQVQQLDIAGRGADLTMLELSLAGGDRSVMHIETVDAAAR